jgi:hypothetical protein
MPDRLLHGADFRRQRMAIINLAEHRKDKLDDMVRWREELMWSYRIIDHRITAADLWLSRQSHLPMRTVFEILYRTVYAQALEYEHSDAETKRRILPSIREQYRLLQRSIPAPYCAAIASQLFEVWGDVLADEEEREKRKMN